MLVFHTTELQDLKTQDKTSSCHTEVSAVVTDGLVGQMIRSANRKHLQTRRLCLVRQVAAVCRGMMLEISALRAQVARLQQEKSSLEEQLGLRFKERYDPLVRHLLATCIQLKVRKVQACCPCASCCINDSVALCVSLRPGSVSATCRWSRM